MICEVDSPLGPLWVESSPLGLRALHRERRELPPGDPHGAAAAFAAYTAGDLSALDALPVDLAGTAFQQQVWAALRTIPPGTTSSYGALTRALGLPLSAARAVGAANGQNRLPIVVPCHRVIGADGALVGFGWGLPAKRALLRHEGALPPEQAPLF